MNAALITGASSGIGHALALELARSKHKLVLMGRNEKALEVVREECLRRGSPDVHTLALDLALKDVATRIQVVLKEKGIEIDILVNNAGIGVHGAFVDTAIDQELQLVHVQIDAMVALAKMVLPGMVVRGSGKILNVCSVYSFSPAPQQAVYAASKAFMFSFSETMAHELKGSGVTVTALCPGSTQTEFRSRVGMHVDGGMDPASVARSGIAAMEAGRFLAIPGIHNCLFANVMRHLPYSLRSPLMAFVNLKRGLRPRNKLRD